jgi:hypothetical protein
MSETPETPAPEAPEEDAVESPAAEAPPPTAEAPAPSTEAPPPSKEIDDANDLRGYHFKKLLSETSTWVIIAVLLIAAGAAAGIYFKSAPIGGAAAGAVLFLSIIGVLAIADSRAEDTFFNVYAQKNGLALGGRSSLPPATPLLRKGDNRYADRTLSGDLAEGVDGVLALYTYEEEHTDSDGNRETNYYRYTVGLVQIPECTGSIPELYVQHKFGLRALEKLEDKFRGSKERVKLESEALDKKYEIFAGKEQDANWLRQLFSPTFIVWLTDEAPSKFALELVNGTLCCYVHDHKENTADLDRMRAATAAVTARLREESLE